MWLDVSHLLCIRHGARWAWGVGVGPPSACNMPVHSMCDICSHLGEGRFKRIWCQKFKIVMHVEIFYSVSSGLTSGCTSGRQCCTLYKMFRILSVFWGRSDRFWGCLCHWSSNWTPRASLDWDSGVLIATNSKISKLFSKKTNCRHLDVNSSQYKLR